ncbi:MAG: hypothetical protein Q8M40_02585 [Legionella sp.]|nr:hypothetical protein [Legionella sp.]
MTRSSNQRNIESLSLIAHRLGDLCDEVTFAVAVSQAIDHRQSRA